VSVHLTLERRGDYVFLNCRICNRIVAQGEDPVLGKTAKDLLRDAVIEHAHEGAW